MSPLHRAVVGVFLASLCVAQDGAGSPGWVTISVRDYEALRTRAYPPEREIEPESTAATLTRVDYDLRVDASVASGTANLTVDVVRDGWVRLPVPQGLLVRDARMGAEPVSLVSLPGKGSPLLAVLSKRGRSTLALNVAFSVSSTAGEEHLSLPVGSSGVTRAAIAFPPQEVDVKVGGGYVAEKSTSRWIAYARGGEPLTFAWRRKVEERRVELPTRLRGSLVQLFGLGEDSTSFSAEVEIEVVQGAASELRIQAADHLIVNQIPGANVADWDLKNGELLIHFLDPVEHSTKFTIVGEARLPRDGPISVPLLRLLDVERETGGVAVEVLGAGEIKDGKAEGLQPADAAELGPTVANRQSPSLAAFRIRSNAPRSLVVTVARYAQQAVLTANIEEARYRVLLTVDGKSLVQARFAVRNNQRDFVDVTLPPGASVWSASLAGRPIRPGKGPSGSLLLPLAKGRAGDEAPPFAVEILYSLPGTAWSSRGRAALALPILDLPVSRTGVILYHPPLFRVTADPGAFRVQPYEALTSSVLTRNGSSGVGLNVEAQDSTRIPSSTQTLIDRYRERADTRKTGETLPLRVSFPSMGPSLFFVSELTSESKGAIIDLSYQKDAKGGVK
ncbi:MAG TPA: hypothetical protein VGN17_10100 [Bryobacteraceae bacterium]|jgi:hypothetical protein